MLDQLTFYIATTVAGLVIGGLFTYAAATSERFAAPRRAKSPEDRTLTDKMIIEADRRIDMINIDQFERFFASFVAAHLDTIIKNAPIIGPMATAADYVDDALEALRRRNPELAIKLNPTKITIHEKLAGAIGKATKDQLTAALQQAGAPAVPSINVPSFTLPQTPYRAASPVYSGDLPTSISSGSAGQVKP